MRTRCRVCGLLRAGGIQHRTGMCNTCQSAYQRFRQDPGWGKKVVGGLEMVRGKLRNTGPLKEVPNVPPHNWFRYIVRERLLRGLNRYPYASHQAREADFRWLPDKPHPWDDVHTVPWDIFKMSPRQAIVLGLVDIEQPEVGEPHGHIGPWGPPEPT